MPDEAPNLVGELSVLVGSEQSSPHARQSLGLAHLEPLIEGVVELDLPSTAGHEYTSSTGRMLATAIKLPKPILTTLLADTPCRQ